MKTKAPHSLHFSFSSYQASFNNLTSMCFFSRMKIDPTNTSSFGWSSTHSMQHQPLTPVALHSETCRTLHTYWFGCICSDSSLRPGLAEDLMRNCSLFSKNWAGLRICQFRKSMQEPLICGFFAMHALAWEFLCSLTCFVVSWNFHKYLWLDATIFAETYCRNSLWFC